MQKIKKATSLDQQFESLNLELQDSNYQLQNKVAELDVITDYLKNILDNMLQGILFLDLNGTIITCNAAAEKILSVESSQVISRRFWEVFKDDVFGFSMHAALNPTVGQQETSIYTVKYSCPLPQPHQSELEVMTAFALNHNDGSKRQNQGLIIMVRDVTEMRCLQTLAARADRMEALGEMAAHVAHEIRNPLGGIKGFASLLVRDLADHPASQKLAASIVEGTDNLNQLVDQILHFARPVPLHPEKRDLMALLEEIKHLFMADANNYKPNIAILIDAPFEKMILSIDAAYFKSALLNLLANAVQAMPEGGTITLSVRKQPGVVILSVSDTGIGISEETLSKLYSPFFTTKPNGNGLGLVEVQKIIQAHGGTIDIISAVNKGTTFTIKFPLQYP